MKKSGLKSSRSDFLSCTVLFFDVLLFFFLFLPSSSLPLHDLPPLPETRPAAGGASALRSVPGGPCSWRQNEGTPKTRKPTYTHTQETYNVIIMINLLGISCYNFDKYNRQELSDRQI